MKKLFIAIVAFLVMGRVALAANLPDYSGYVNDFANVLSDSFEHKLEGKLVDFDHKTTNQIAVVTVQTTQPDEIEQYSIDLAEKWKPGVKGKDNGVIMLFAMQDHKMRIEVGRGLEGDLTDVESKHIIDDIITPEFKQQHFEQGIDKGVDAVIVAISTQEPVAAPATENSGGGVDWFIVILIGGTVLLVILSLSRHTPLGGEGDGNVRGLWVPKEGSKWGKRKIGVIKKERFIPIIPPIFTSTTSSDDDDDDDDSSSSGWGGINIGGGSFGDGGSSFGGGSFSGGGASGGW